MPKGFLLTDTTTEGEIITRPEQAIVKAGKPTDGYEETESGLLLPRNLGIAVAGNNNRQILIPEPEQITELIAKNPNDKEKLEAKYEGNIAAFLYDPMAYIERRILSEENMGYRYDAEVTNILKWMTALYHEQLFEEYKAAQQRLEVQLDREGKRPEEDPKWQELMRGIYIHADVMETSSRGLLGRDNETGEQVYITKAQQALRRESREVQYYDKNTDATSTRVVNSPSVMEEVAVAIFEELNAPNIRKAYPEVQGILEAFSNTLKTYRECAETEEISPRKWPDKLAKPEMPEATRLCISILENETISPALRSTVYDILEQVTIPKEYAETILQNMDTSNDLHHALAFQLSTELSKSESVTDSTFMKTQEKIRVNLLETLQMDAQSCFDNFDGLMEQAKGLVSSQDLTHVTQGIIGVEVEFNHKALKRTYMGHLVNFNPILNGYDLGSNLDDGFEARKKVQNLDHNLDHITDSLELRRAFLDMRENVHLSSLHIQLDKLTHPVEPTMAGYFITDTRLLTRENRHTYKDGIDRDTFEIRGLVVPKDKPNGFNVARMEDATNMLILMSHTKPNTTDTQIRLGEEQITDWKKVVFGHVCRLYDDPQIRLACLMGLQDDMMLRGGAIESFIVTYGIDIYDHLSPAAFPGDYRKLNEVKTALERGDFSMDMTHDNLRATIALNPQNRYILKKIMGKELENPDLELQTAYLMYNGLDVIQGSPSLSQKFVDIVKTRVHSPESIRPQYFVKCLNIMTASETEMSKSAEEKNAFVLDLLGSVIRSDYRNMYPDSVFDHSMESLFNGINTYLGEDAWKGQEQRYTDLFIKNLRNISNMSIEKGYLGFMKSHDMHFSKEDCVKILELTENNPFILDHVLDDIIEIHSKTDKDGELFSGFIDSLGDGAYLAIGLSIHYEWKPEFEAVLARTLAIMEQNPEKYQTHLRELLDKVRYHIDTALVRKMMLMQR